MEHIPQVFWLIPIASVCALAMAWYFFKSMMKAEEGTPRMPLRKQMIYSKLKAMLKGKFRCAYRTKVAHK